MPPDRRSHPRLRVGVSSCLLGEAVRYDGGHKRCAFLAEALARLVEYVPVCPEVELGLGTPREPIHLVRDRGRLRLLGVRTAADHTRAMNRFARARLEALDREGLDGYVLKAGSPSCGIDRVPVRGPSGALRKAGRGLFAGPLIDRFPLLAVEEEGRLESREQRRNFLVRLWAGRRLRGLLGSPWTREGLVRFHASEKLLLLAHDPEGCRELDRWVARVRDGPGARFAERYGRRFMEALARPSPRGREIEVLARAAGSLERVGTPEERAGRARAIEEYRRGLSPLEVPLGLLRRAFRADPVAGLDEPTYFDPFPRELEAAPV